MFKDKILLVTGGTGSFGHALVRRFINEDIKEIRILSRDEKKQDDMRKEFNDPRLKFYIGDVRDKSTLKYAVKGSDYIFHAAALKQVPSCEFFPLEAVKTNIIGTDNVLDTAIDYNVKRVVCLSTDKAAYPINAMGMSKALMEKTFIAKARMAAQSTNTVICGTRYGNVMASRGSVIPLFLEQIAAGKPITITDPKMTRFLMSLDDAVDLVIFAFLNGEQGDLFVQKSPASTIEDLATAVLDLTKSNVGTRVIGTRHGEKVYESLLTREEYSKSYDLGDYYKVPMDQRDLNYENYFVDGVEVKTQQEYNSENTYRLSVDEIKEKLINLYEIKEQLKVFL